MTLKQVLLTAAAVTVLGVSAASAGTLDDVKARGTLNCIVNTGLAGFGGPNDKGEWSGLDVDLCRAVAAAVLGDASKVNFIPSTAKERFTKLQSGEGDMLARNSTWTLSRDSELALDFVGVNYYDGQGFMVRKDSGVTSAKDLGGATVCVQTGTTTELNLADYFRSNGLELKSVVFEKSDEGRGMYDAGQCDAYTTDASGLAAERTALGDPAAHIILPEIISKEPLGPAVRHGDSQWADVVRWSLNAMIAAEEYGVTQANVAEQLASSTNPEVRRLLGAEGDMGAKLGLPNDWAVKIISSVGNYGESFERNVGVNTPLGLERGLNAQWANGGLMYSPPVR
jgi:general L-amino acid transport system substrate-binding protein